MKILCLLLCLMVPHAAAAQGSSLTVSAPVVVRDTGLLRHILPRFALKHGVRVTVVDSGGDVVIGETGIAVFDGLGTVWHISQSDSAEAATLTEWLLSDIGKRAIDGFTVDGIAPFSTEIAPVVVTREAPLTGDPAEGERLSLLHCGRCHVINATNRMKGMGQTPSFALMRTFDDWQNRFSTFYALNPHPSFTQVADITRPFSVRLPPAIVPVEVTQDEVDAIVAYVATMTPADLGAPLQNQ